MRDNHSIKGLITALTFLTLAFLAGCATTTQVTPVTDASLMPVNTIGWTATGKASLQGPAGTETINLQWTRLWLTEDRALISGPAGLGAIKLQRSGDQVFWLEDDQPKSIAELPLDSAARRTAEQLPVADLGEWLLGYPPVDGDWRVSIDQWQGIGRWRLPRKLLLQNADYRIRLVLLDWQFRPAQ